MATNRKDNARHRWTQEEREKLLDASLAYTTISEAADALYVDFGHPRQAVYSQLYDLFLRGKAPHLSLSKERGTRNETSPAFARALRELVRVMRLDGASDILVSVKADSVHVQISRSATTLDLDL